MREQSTRHTILNLESKQFVTLLLSLWFGVEIDCSIMSWLFVHTSLELANLVLLCLIAYYSELIESFHDHAQVLKICSNYLYFIRKSMKFMLILSILDLDLLFNRFLDDCLMICGMVVGCLLDEFWMI